MNGRLVSLLVMGVLLLMNGAPANEEEDTTLVKAGDIAPAFTCKTIDGIEFSMEKLKGKVVYINFFATWCGPCLSEVPQLEKSIYRAFREDKDFALIVIGREHTNEELTEFRERIKSTMPYAADPDRAIYGKYAKKYIPRNVIIGRDGVVRYAEAGFDATQKERIVQILEAELAKSAPEDSTP